MKALLVTSRITYVPGNYRGIFDSLFETAPEAVGGLVILDNVSAGLARDIAGLGALGCRGIAGTLLKNLAGLRADPRERIFSERGLPVLRAASMNDPEVIRWVRQQGFELIVNVRTRCIYGREILATPRLGCLNIHHGLLPEYRDTLCDLYALSEGRPAGFTLHAMNERIDAGRIFHREEVPSEGGRDYVAYLARTGRAEGVALGRFLGEVQRTGALPEGIPNECVKPVFTRNPNRKEIRELRAKGIAL